MMMWHGLVPVLYFLVQVAGIKGSFPVSDFNGNLGRFGLDNQNRQRGFHTEKSG